MIVNRHEIPQEAIDRGIERMKKDTFTAMNIYAAMDCKEAYRAADRLIQRERKAGNIAFNNKYWIWVGPR